MYTLLYEEEGSFRYNPPLTDNNFNTDEMSLF